MVSADEAVAVRRNLHRLIRDAASIDHVILISIIKAIAGRQRRQEIHDPVVLGLGQQVGNDWGMNALPPAAETGIGMTLREQRGTGCGLSARRTEVPASIFEASRFAQHGSVHAVVNR